MGRSEVEHEKVSFLDFLHLLKWFVEHRKEVIEFMAQAQFTLSLTIAAASSPLTLTPASGSLSLTQGVASTNDLAVISGGTAPYTASVDGASPNPLPPGLALSVDTNNNLVLNGTPTAAGSGTVLIDVTDSAGAVSQVKAKL